VKYRHSHSKKRFRQNGALLILLLFMIVAMLALSGFCIGVSQIQLANTEAQIVADCASMSATTMIGEEDNHTGTYNTPLEVAQYIPSKNTVMGSQALIEDRHVQIGRAKMSSSGKLVFTANASPRNAVKVTVGTGDGFAMQPQSLLFPFQMSMSRFSIQQESISAKLEHDICLVLDRSGSMRSNKGPGRYPYHPDRTRPYWFYYPHPTDSRWGAVINAINPLVESLNETPMTEKCSIVTFGSGMSWADWSWNTSDTNVEPTTHYENLFSTMQALGESKPMHGGTHISAGMDRALDLLTGPQSRDFAFKTMVVLTDGNENSGSNAEAAAVRAAEAGVTVHTITFASTLGFSTMQRTAEAGGGSAYWAPDEETLREIFKEIGSAPPVALIE
jgi:Mg-chelatase subunit ChlD